MKTGSLRWWGAVLSLLFLITMASPSSVYSAPPDVQLAVNEALEVRARALLGHGNETTITGLYEQGFAEGADIVGANLVAYEQAKIQEFHDYAAKRGMEYTEAKVELEFKRVDVVGNTARVQVVESLALTYHYPDTNPGIYTTFGLGMDHVMELALVEGRWLIRRDDYIDAFRQWLGPDHVTPRSFTETPTEEQSSSSNPEVQISPAGTVNYDGNKAAQYADKYCGSAAGCGNSRKYNTAEYGTEPDDCTNFVSQALGDASEGGGAPHSSPRSYTTNWYYDYPTKTGSIAWVRASSLVAFLTNHPGGENYDYAWEWGKGSYSHVTDPTPDYPNGLIWHMYKGDVMGYDLVNDPLPDHTALVAAYDGANYPLVNAHNADQYHAPWDLGRGPQATYYLLRMKMTITVP